MKLETGPIIVTPWVFPRDGSHGIGCPLCRTWSQVDPSAVGKELSCPNCSGRLKLNPFTIEGEWPRVAKAWKGWSDD
jgi:hypothetical protein